MLKQRTQVVKVTRKYDEPDVLRTTLNCVLRCATIESALFARDANRVKTAAMLISLSAVVEVAD